MEATNVILQEALSLLRESLDHIDDKPWDDSTRLHERISTFLGLPVSYPDWGKHPEDE